MQHLALKTGKFPKNGDPGAIRTRDVLLRRTRVVLFVHLVSFDFLSFRLDLSRNSASFPKRQTGLIVGFVWLSRTPLLAEFQLFPSLRKPAIPSLPQGKEMQSMKERLALLCPAAFSAHEMNLFQKEKQSDRYPAHPKVPPFRYAIRHSAF